MINRDSNIITNCRFIVSFEVKSQLNLYETYSRDYRYLSVNLNDWISLLGLLSLKNYYFRVDFMGFLSLYSFPILILIAFYAITCLLNILILFILLRY